VTGRVANHRGEPKTHTPSLKACHFKVARAYAHINSLDNAVSSFLEKNPYRIEIEPYRQRIEKITLSAEEFAGAEFPEDRVSQFTPLLDGGFEFRHQVVDRVRLRIHVVEHALTERWGVMIGEITHNLRSSLDHLIWQLTLANGHESPKEPIARGSKWRETAFPIFDEREGFTATNRHGKPRRGSGLAMLWGLRPDQVEMIDRFQPYQMGGENTHRHPLRVLQELWNRDKHRTINLAHSIVRLEEVGPPSDFWRSDPDLPDVRVRIIKRMKLGPFEDGTEIARLGITAKPVGLGMSELLYYFGATPADMRVNLDLTFDIAFEDGPPAHGGPVIATLKAITRAVGNVLDSFRHEFS
jgi:hypothetical protein